MTRTHLLKMYVFIHKLIIYFLYDNDICMIMSGCWASTHNIVNCLATRLTFAST